MSSETMTATATDLGWTKKGQQQEPKLSRDAMVSRRKPPVRLVREGDGVVVATACGTCGRVYQLNDSFAERCCDPRCADCGADLPLRGCYTCCTTCRSKREAAQDADRRLVVLALPAAAHPTPETA